MGAGRGSSLVSHQWIHRFVRHSDIVLRCVMPLEQRIELFTEPGFQHLDLGVGHAKGAADLELNGPTRLVVRTFSSPCRWPPRRACCFPLNGHSPTRGQVCARGTSERGRRALARLVTLRAAGSPGPPVADRDADQPVSPAERPVR